MITTNDVRDETGRTVEERLRAIEEAVGLAPASGEPEEQDQGAAWFRDYRARVRAREAKGGQAE